MSPETLATLIALIAPTIAVIGSIAGLAWWLAGQFSFNRHTFYGSMKQMSAVFEDKIDEHEARDAERFKETNARIDQLRQEIWDIKVRNAERDGVPTPRRP